MANDNRAHTRAPGQSAGRRGPARVRRCCWAVLAVLGLVLSACGSSTPAKTVNGLEVNLAIASEILEQHHVDTTVECPEPVLKRAGFTFTCAANFKVGSDRIKVIETDDRGHITYTGEVPLVTLDLFAVDRAIKQAAGTQAGTTKVKCPTQVLQKSGVSFTCTATVGGKTHTFKVTETSNSGQVRVEEQ